MTDFISGKAAIARDERGQGRLKWELTKTLRIMKLAAFLLFTAAMHVSAKGLTQDKITLSLKNAPLEKVFDAIETQSGFVFIYKNETVKDKKVSIQVTNVSLAAALDECLKGQALSYQIVGKSVAIKTIHKETNLVENETANAPPLIDVKGKVLNEKGEPVEGVTVRVKGSEKFTLTDKNGEFSLVTVERDATLLFTHITMESFELQVSGQTELLIKLRTKVSSLGEVVVSVNTGYQQISKERFVGSYSQLDSTAYNRRAGLGIIDRLDGTVTGILVDKKTIGNTLSNLQIRGLSTLLSNRQPLIIVDNFEYTLDNLDNINPNDVENVTVLKDAAATSIWGARAGNGVIVITTKKGKFNQPLRVSIRSNTTISEKPELYYYPQMAVADFVDMEQSLFNKGYYDAFLSNTTSMIAVTPVVELLAQRRAGKISTADSAAQMDAFKQLDLRRDLHKYAFRNAVSQQHYINLSAGSDVMAYNFSAGYNSSLNNVQHSKADDQFTLNSNVRLKPVKNLEISNGIRYSYGRNRSASFLLPSMVYPYMQLADAEGHFLAVPYRYRISYLDTAGAGQLLDWKYRPLEEPGLVDRSTISRTIQLNLSIAYRIASWLNASVSYQYTNEIDDLWDYASLRTYSTRDRINLFSNLSQTTPTLRNPIPIGGILSTKTAKASSQNFRGGLNFDKSFFGGLHRVSAIMMADISEAASGPFNTNTFFNYDKDKGTYQQYVDYTTYFPQYLGNITSRVPIGSALQTGTLFRFVSYSGNVSYNYKGLYTIYGSARRDGSNVFGVNTNNKWKPLWSVGTSWDVSKERFYHVSWMSSLRLRTSYGYAGNPGPNDVTGFPVIEYSSTFANYTNLPFGRPRSAPNPDLRWEKVETINGGVDFSVLKNRISGSIDVWQKRSTDLISNMPVAPATGVGVFATNSANLKGNGFELSLVTKNITGAFEWQSNLGLSRAKTVVTKLLTNYPRFKAVDYTQYALNATEGRIVYGISSYRWAGLDPATGDPRGYLGKQVTTDYNSIFDDSVKNQVFNGSAIPLYSGFIGNTFHWKSFTLSANITYRLNFYFRKPTINYEQLVSTGYGHSDYALRWQKPGDEKFTNIPSFTYPINSIRDQFFQNSEINVLRGDNIRLQDARLQYDWNNKKGNKATVKGFQLFVYANNLNIILWRKNKSKLDPDFIGASNVLNTPTAKTYAGGISLSF